MTKTTSDILGILVYLALIIAIVIFGPLAIIWSLNTLFPVVAIPYTFWNWLAVVILNATWMGAKVINKKD